jgi:hypothetical protein
MDDQKYYAAVTMKRTGSLVLLVVNINKYASF